MATRSRGEAVSRQLSAVSRQPERSKWKALRPGVGVGSSMSPTAGGAEVEGPVAITDPVDWSLRAARYRWAES
jgi:hypothetical protein